MAAAQTSGRIEGIVRDAAGEALPGVAVEASSGNLQGFRSASTDAGGRFQLLALPPGSYVARATRAGFRPAETPVTVSLDATATADFVLEAAFAAQVSVGGDAPPIDPTATTGGTSYTAGVVSRLPTGRNYSDIVQSNPGVSTDRGDTQGRSLPLTIYGATSNENQWIIDGINTTSAYRGFQGKALNMELVQEVEIKTGGYQAEYGGALGGVVNVITKAGGNEFHGDAYAYYDSMGTAAAQVFTAADSTINTMRLVSGQRVDAGADLGGFVVRDRLWFFASYDHVHFDGDVSRVAKSDYVGTTERFPLQTTDDLYSGKATWNAAPSTTIVAIVLGDPSTNSGAAGADPRQGVGDNYVTPITNLNPSTWSSSRALGGTDFGLNLSQLFGSRGVATLQGALHRDQNGLQAADAVRIEDATCEGGTRDIPCTRPTAPSATGGYGNILGVLDNFSSHRAQLRVDASVFVGNHEIKGGAGYEWDRSVSDGLYTGGQLVTIRNDHGVTYFEHEYLSVDPDLAPAPSGPRQATIHSYSVYLQDSWRVLPGLTVNAGLRWDGQGTRDYTGQSVLSLYDGWQPRIGVAWDPWRDGATKVYGFVGRFDYALPTALVLNSFANTLRVTTYNYSQTSLVPADVYPYEPHPYASGGPLGDSVDAGLKPGYQDELTFGVERQASRGLTLGVKATYRRLGGVIQDRCDFADVDSGNTCAIINPGSDGLYARGDAPTCNGLDHPYDDICPFPRGPATPAAARTYRGVEVVARQSVSDRLWIQASFVRSSLRGNYDGGVNQSSYGQTSPGYSSDFDYPALWHDASGTLSLDRTNRFRLDAFWVAPFGLSVGLQAFVETGAPLNQLGYFSNNYGAAIDLVQRGSAGRLPTLWEGNLTVSYPFMIGPVTATLQAYLFDIFNNQIATSVDEEWTIGPTNDYPVNLFNPNQPSNNTLDYGKVTSRSAPRSFRAAVRLSF